MANAISGAQKAPPTSNPARHTRRDWIHTLTATTALVAPAVIAAPVPLPKDMAYAAPGRLALTAATFAAGIVGAAATAALWRRWREACLWRSYGPASSAVRDTLSYLRNERRLARRGQLPALLLSLGALGLHVLSQWPQLAVLAPYSRAFGAAGLGLVAAMPFLALRQRGHLVNAFFLRRYLGEQVAHLGYRPPRRLRRRLERLFFARKAAPPVVVTRPGAFAIGGFEWTLEDGYKNILCIGIIGSGKTACVLNSFLYGLIAATNEGMPKIAGLVLDAKGDYAGKLAAVCDALGRSEDLFILDPAAWPESARTRRSIAWNPLDNDDDALEIATRLIAVLRLIGLEQGHEGSFFIDSAKVFLRHAITLARAAAGAEPAALADIYRLAQESEEETPLYHAMLKALSANYPGVVPQVILDAIRYFEQNWRMMADREKSGVRGTLTQLLDEFLVPPFDQIFAGRSTISVPAVLDEGKLLYVYMKASERERMSRIVSTLVKLEMQRQVLLRPGKARPSFFLCDEFQTFYTTGEGRGDSDMLERSRESRHVNILATQNISAFLKRTRNAHDVKNFLGNCAVKIFLRSVEEETLRWASDLFGQRSEIVITTSEQAAFEGGWSRRRMTSYGRSARLLPAMPPSAFIALAIPERDDPERRHSEGIVHLGSRGSIEHHRLVFPVNPLR